MRSSTLGGMLPLPREIFYSRRYAPSPHPVCSHLRHVPSPRMPALSGGMFPHLPEVYSISQKVWSPISGGLVPYPRKSGPLFQEVWSLIPGLFNKVKNHFLKHLDNIEGHLYLFYAQKVLLEDRN